jgi:P-type Cu+ transporter
MHGSSGWWRASKNVSEHPWRRQSLEALAQDHTRGVLFPFFGVLLSPITASAAMTFSSVSVIGNALRLRRAQL